MYKTKKICKTFGKNCEICLKIDNYLKNRKHFLEIEKNL